MYDNILKNAKTIKNIIKKYQKTNKRIKIMRFFLFILISCFSGIFAGMGMGGGTFLIPLLSLFFGIEQIICQSTNVVCFVVLDFISETIAKIKPFYYCRQIFKEKI